MAAAPDWGEIDTFVLLVLEELGIDTSQLDLDAPLEDTEIENQDLAELARVVSERFGTRVRPSDLTRAGTLGKALQVIHRKLE
jgi:Phosphopantetheine attachment site